MDRVDAIAWGVLALVACDCAHEQKAWKDEQVPRIYRTDSAHHRLGMPSLDPARVQERKEANKEHHPVPTLAQVEAAIRVFQRQRMARGPETDTAWEPFLQTVFDYMDQPVGDLRLSPLIRARVAAEFELDADTRRSQGADPELTELVTSLLKHIDYRVRRLRTLTTGAGGRTLSMALDGRLSWPLAFGLITSGFGSRMDPLNPSREQHHEGIDLAAPPHEPVYATGAGTVVFVGSNAGYGRMVRIRHGQGLETVYAHLAATLVLYDQEVTQGQVIGLLGRTGRTTGHHLHFGVYVKGKAVDPMEHLAPIPLSFSDTTPGVLFGHP